MTEKIPELSIRRFRANIIGLSRSLAPRCDENMGLLGFRAVSGPKAFNEDGWKKITFAGKMYYSGKLLPDLILLKPFVTFASTTISPTENTWI